MSPDGEGRPTAKEAFDAIVEKKTRYGLRRIRGWDYLQIPDDVWEDPVLKAVHDETDRLAAREIIRQIMDPSALVPEGIHLTALADLTGTPETLFRVDQVMPADGNVLIVAQRKAGKTVLALNLARAVLGGTDFLGMFPVTPVAGSLAFFNYELSPQMFAAWCRDLGLPEDRLLVANMRGYGNPLGSKDAKDKLAKVMRSHAVEVLVIDPFSVAYTGQDANSPYEVRTWLTQLEDWFRGQAEGREIVLTAHAGWSSDDRARGASSLEDWPDSIITLKSNAQSQRRTFAVRGRDVTVDPVAIEMHPETRVLQTGGVSRQEPLSEACLEIVREETGLNTEQISTALRDKGVSFRKGEENRALRELIASGQVKVRLGSKGARLHYPA